MSGTKQAGLLAVVGVVSLVVALAAAEGRLPCDDEGWRDAAEHIFLDGEITFVYVTVDPSDLQDMLANPWSDVYRVCSVRIVNSVVDETLDNVGIRPRGNTSREAVKKSWKLSFNEFVPGRQFHGLERFNINGEHNDPSIIRSKLAWDLFQAMGVPSPRAHHVQLKINDGTYVEGMHVNVEQIDEELAEAWFGNKDGNLYKCRYQGDRADLRYISPGTPETYQNLGGGETYEEHNNDPNSDYTDLADFIDFVNNSNDTTFAAEIVDRFSVDNFLRAMAVDVTIGQWDNYWYGANNYYLYHNEDTGRFEYIPYDYDNTYGVDFMGIDWANRAYDTWGDGGYGSHWGQLPPLIDRILEIPAYEQQYRRYLRQLANGEFTLAATETKIDQIKAMITPYAFTGSYDGNMDWDYTAAMFDESYTYPTSYRNWGWGWDWGLKPYIQTRTSYLLSHVPVPPALPRLYINEMLAGNQSINTDEMGEYEDWVEIYNDESYAVDVGGMYLTDDPAEPKQWQIPVGVSIPAKGFLLVWCDDDTLDGPLHANFKLSGNGEGVGLFHTDAAGNVLIDYLAYPALRDDVSYGRYADGADTVGFMATPSPAAANNPHNEPPLIESVAHSPDEPAAGVVVWVTAEVTDDVSLSTVTLTYNAGSGAQSVTMYDDGAHEDGAAGDDVFGAAIPGFAQDTVVAYFLSAADGADGLVTDPAGAPAEAYTYTVGQPPLTIYINEFMADNDGAFEDPDDPGDYEDWLELYNPGSAAVDLGGMFLTDDLSDPTQFEIPAGVVIPARGFVVFWADDETAQGPLHTNFKLSKSGEAIGLFDTLAHGNVTIDAVTFAEQTTDVSYGRYPDGGAAWQFFASATPGWSNVLLGDLDGDDDVDLADLQALLATYGKCPGDAGYESLANLSNDGQSCIGLADLQLLLSNYGASR